MPEWKNRPALHRASAERFSDVETGGLGLDHLEIRPRASNMSDKHSTMELNSKLSNDSLCITELTGEPGSDMNAHREESDPQSVAEAAELEAELHVEQAKATGTRVTTRTQAAQPGAQSRRISQRGPEHEGRRELKPRSQGRRSDPEEDWQSKRRSWSSLRPPQWHSQDQSSHSDSGEKQAQGSQALKASRLSLSRESSASNSDSPRISQSPRAAAMATSLPQSAQEQLWLREERKQQEKLLKALETPEEKRTRRLAKKEAKERKRRLKMGWDEDYMGYSNSDNPFGDNNLLDTFIWRKALEKKDISHLGEKQLKERTKRIQEESRLELQKVKRLRQEREREKALREHELEWLQREKEAEHFRTWEEQEHSFHLRQAKLRSKIRIRDGRAKPIDLLAKYISREDDFDLAVEIHEPYTFLNGLTVTDMEDLLEDIQVFMELEQGKNVDFWRDMMTITEDEIAKLRKLEASGQDPGERREGVNPSVSSDVQSVFQGKTYNQLQGIFQGIEGKIRAGGPNLDMGYWESLLQQLRAHMAKARLRERHQHLLKQKLIRLKQGQGVESESRFPILKSEPRATHSPEPEERPISPGTSVDPVDPVEPEEDTTAEEAGSEAVLMKEDLIGQSLSDYDAGRYSPRMLRAHELPVDAHVLEPHEDLQRMQLSRQQLQAPGDASQSAEDIFFRHAREGMGQDEAQFSVEMPLGGRSYLWADKYRPRKPRYFNRVHTGFEWNRYNRTHYDVDNPPPKIVQGYKFNIFYPDLIIRKHATPEYFLEDCADNPDFAILRFHAGPPYEDIAFKIVRREWDHSHRHGFRCQFANGIFQLWFHFKRYHYRR
ncbi:cactin-like [Grammomys surdaster]|uniref:cactin-like n=1 Tax=Grammomys surdaster TaxID=491861 RepID=UPI00109F308C|nr:cactin-like [Grammomys surdaster]